MDAKRVIEIAKKNGLVRVTGPCEWRGNECRSGFPYGSPGEAVHIVKGVKLCGFHSPYDTNAETLAQYGFVGGPVVMTNPTTVKYVKVGKGKADHLASEINGVTSETSLCGRRWDASAVIYNPDTRCKLCVKVWDEMCAKILAESTREAVIETENERSHASDQGFSPSEAVAVDLEIVYFGGKAYHLVEWVADTYWPDSVDHDWLRLRAVDGSGSVTVQRFDLDPHAPGHKMDPLADTVDAPSVSVDELLTLLDSDPWAPAVMPTPRREFTPADLDALNLRRHLGEWVRVANQQGFAILHDVVARRGSTPPGVRVIWGDGQIVECALAEIMLSRANECYV